MLSNDPQKIPGVVTKHFFLAATMAFLATLICSYCMKKKERKKSAMKKKIRPRKKKLAGRGKH